MVGKSAAQNIVEYLGPWIGSAVKKCCCNAKSNKIDVNRVAPWERDHRTLPPEDADLNLYDDYREIMLQLSFMSLYAPAFVLAPIFSLFNNLFEVRIDATKMLKHQRRPHCGSSNDIGIWMKFMQTISWLSVVVNGALLCFTSNFIPMIVYRWKFYETTPGSLEGYVRVITHLPSPPPHPLLPLPRPPRPPPPPPTLLFFFWVKKKKNRGH